MSEAAPEVASKRSRSGLDRTVVGSQSLDDALLMRRVQIDDAEAFGALYDRFAGRAYGLALNIAHNDARAQDVVQDAFLSVWRSRASYRPERGTVNSWILGTVRNRALDSLRRNGRHDTRRAPGEGIAEQLQALGDLEHTIAERDQASRLRALLATLPDAQRDVITLAYFGEMSTSEIARELSVPHGTVKGRMRLGLTRLRTTLPEHPPARN